MSETPSTQDVAFALGGLAGNNAHGAGFLQAALDHPIKPLMISATSGQIRWVYHYLQALRAPHPPAGVLRATMRQALALGSPFRNRNLDLLALSLGGFPGVFRPAWAGFWFDFLENAAATLHRSFKAGFDVVPFEEALKTWPCRRIEPVKDGFDEAASNLFNGVEDIGLVFNSFNPVDGLENIYLNRRARELLVRDEPGRRCHYRPGGRSTYRERTTYQEITPQAVRDALWLYDYGFDAEDRPESHQLYLDGAYFRDVILNELTPAGRIYVARPVNYRWMGRLPTNYADLEDLKTRMLFNGTYDGERHQILLINKLLAHRRLRETSPESVARPGGGHDGGYHHVDLVEVEIQLPRGFLDYAFESEAVFEDGYRLALKAFRWNESGERGPAGAAGARQQVPDEQPCPA